MDDSTALLEPGAAPARPRRWGLMLALTAILTVTAVALVAMLVASRQTSPAARAHHLAAVQAVATSQTLASASRPTGSALDQATLDALGGVGAGGAVTVANELLSFVPESAVSLYRVESDGLTTEVLVLVRAPDPFHASRWCVLSSEVLEPTCPSDPDLARFQR